MYLQFNKGVWNSKRTRIYSQHLAQVGPLNQGESTSAHRQSWKITVISLLVVAYALTLLVIALEIM